MAVHTLADTMNAPSARPNVVVLDSTYQEDIDALKEKPLNAAEDLWLSTVDGRYSSPPIPVRVGSLHNMQTFHVGNSWLLLLRHGNGNADKLMHFLLGSQGHSYQGPVVSKGSVRQLQRG